MSEKEGAMTGTWLIRNATLPAGQRTDLLLRDVTIAELGAQLTDGKRPAGAELAVEHRPADLGGDPVHGRVARRDRPEPGTAPWPGRTCRGLVRCCLVPGWLVRRYFFRHDI